MQQNQWIISKTCDV